LLPAPGREDESSVTKERGFKKTCSLFIARQEYINKIRIKLKDHKGEINFYNYRAFILYEFETMHFIYPVLENDNVINKLFPEIMIHNVDKYEYRDLDNNKLTKVKYPTAHWIFFQGKLVEYKITFKNGDNFDLASEEEGKEKIEKAFKNDLISKKEKEKALLIIINKLKKGNLGLLITKKKSENEKMKK
jgi:hypothetical protein